MSNPQNQLTDTPALTLEDRVRNVLTDILYEPALKTIAADKNLMIDAGLDSLDLIEATMAIEDAFNCEIPDNTSREFRTINDIVAAVQAHATPL